MKFHEASALNGEGVNEMFNHMIEEVHLKQEKKKRKIDDMEIISSSQNIHKDDMDSNRSQMEKYQETMNNPSIKISGKNFKNIENPSSVGLQSGKDLPKEVQGGNRCC